MTQAICWPNSRNASETRAASLKGSTNVYSARALGTPGDVGTPKVSAPEPALMSSESE